MNYSYSCFTIPRDENHERFFKAAMAKIYPPPPHPLVPLLNWNRLPCSADVLFPVKHFSLPTPYRGFTPIAEPNPPRFNLVATGTFHESYDPDTGEFLGMEEDYKFVQVNAGDARYPDAPFEERLISKEYFTPV